MAKYCLKLESAVPLQPFLTIENMEFLHNYGWSSVVADCIFPFFGEINNMVVEDAKRASGSYNYDI